MSMSSNQKKDNPGHFKGMVRSYDVMWQVPETTHKTPCEEHVFADRYGDKMRFMHFDL